MPSLEVWWHDRIIDFAGSDLAEGQLGNGLCKAMDSSIFILVLLQVSSLYGRLCSSSVRGDICALSCSDDVLASLAVCGSSSVAFCAWLTVAGRDCTTI